MIEQIRQALESSTGAPFALYGWRETPAFAQWGIVTMDGQSDAIWADGHMQEQALRGHVSLFSKSMATSIAAKVQEALDGLGVSWELETTDYEQDTGLIHYTWRWREWGEIHVPS